MFPTVILLLIFSYIQPASADAFYIDDFFTPPTEDVVASNRIYLDSSTVGHPVMTFPSPSEYQKTYVVVPKTIPSPSEYSPKNNKAHQSNKTSVDEPLFVTPNYVPPSKYKAKQNRNSSEDDVFAPPQNDNSMNILPAQINENMAKYYYDNDIDYEGKMITSVHYSGLKSVREDVVKSVVTTGSGVVFNAERLQEDLQRIYNTGYFTDEMSVEPTLKDDGTVELNFILKENIPVTKVLLSGNSVVSTKELMPFVKHLKGLPQNLNLINDSIEKIDNYYHEKGYILAGVASIDDTSDGELRFIISEGVIEDIIWEGNEKTKDFVIERNVMTKRGSVYNEEYIKKDLARLYSTQIFEEVDRKIEPSQNNDGQYIVTIKIKENPSNSLSVGGGIDNALGVFGSVGYNEKNFMGRAQQLNISGMVGSGILLSDASIKNRMNYNIELTFKEPHFINADNSLTSKLFYRDLGSYQVPLAEERRWGINAVVEHKVRKYDNLTTNLGVGFEHIKLKEGDYTKISELYRRNNINISRRQEQLIGGSFFNIAPGVKYSTVDNEDMPRDGIIAKASFMEAFSPASIKRTNGRLVGGITKYTPVFKDSTLAIGAKGGIKVHGDEMPEVMAFRLGGPYTVRGFKMNGVGSGEAFLMGSAELQTPIPFFDKFKYDVLKNMRFAFFVDAGRVFDPTITSTLFDRPMSAITAGVGLRVYIPGMGPISIDYGVPFTNPGKYGSKGGCFTFGTGGIYDN